MDRQQRLLQLMSDGRKSTKEELRRGLDLQSTRHVLRLIKALRAEGVPVAEERDGRQKRFFLKPEPRHLAVRPVWLSEEELMALVVAVQAGRAALAPTPFRAPLRRAFERVVGDFAPRAIAFEPEETPRHWHFGEAQSVDLDPEVFQAVVYAVRNRQSLRIDYFTASRQHWSRDRKIDPLLVGVRGGSWLVAAYCHRKQALRDFALAGITAAKPCDPAEGGSAYFSPPDDFDPDLYFRDRFSAVSGDEVHVVRLLVAPDRLPYFKRKNYHPTQQIEEERPDGWAVVSYEVEGLKEVRAFVRSWGPGVIVLEPTELARQVKRDAEALIHRYQHVRTDQT